MWMEDPSQVGLEVLNFKAEAEHKLSLQLMNKEK